jgi:hypothetical protein
MSKSTLVTQAQFDNALVAIDSATATSNNAIIIATRFIAQCADYKAQQVAIKSLVKVYSHMIAQINGNKLSSASALTWVRRRVVKLHPKIKWLKSTNASAKSNAKKRGTKAPAGKAPAAPAGKAKTESDTVKAGQTPAQLLLALLARERQTLDAFRNFVPSGKQPEFEQAYSAFLITLKAILS